MEQVGDARQRLRRGEDRPAADDGVDDGRTVHLPKRQSLAGGIEEAPEREEDAGVGHGEEDQGQGPHALIVGSPGSEDKQTLLNDDLDGKYTDELRVNVSMRLSIREARVLRRLTGTGHGNSQHSVSYGRRMPMLRIEIPARDRIEAKRIQALYQRGERHVKLDEEATERTWESGYIPVGRPVFVGLTNGEPLHYRFDVPVETAVS